MDSFKRNIIITGGAGFIGSHVVRLFVNKYPEYRIINLDKLTYAGNLANLKDIEDKPNYIFVKADICDFGTIQELLVRYQVDGIIHLAAESHVDRSIKDPFTFAQTNVMGTLALLLTLKDALLQQPLAALALTAGVAAALFLLGRRLLRCFLRSRLSGNFHGLLLEVRFCRLLALLLESGVGITRAVAIVTDTIDDEQYAGQLRLLNSRLKRGIAIEQAAGGAKELFSPLMLELVCVGASTGYLPQMLQEAVTAGEQRLQQQLGRLQELLVPLLLLVAAIIIAGIVCIVIGPLFEMLSAMPE